MSDLYDPTAPNGTTDSDSSREHTESPSINKTNEDVYNCQFCEKTENSEELLRIHCLWKHPHEMPLPSLTEEEWSDIKARDKKVSKEISTQTVDEEKCWTCERDHRPQLVILANDPTSNVGGGFTAASLLEYNKGFCIAIAMDEKVAGVTKPTFSVMREGGIEPMELVCSEEEKEMTPETNEPTNQDE